MAGESGTSQKDWYPHPKIGLRSISYRAKSHMAGQYVGQDRI
jgi:hypothetical protein